MQRAAVVGRVGGGGARGRDVRGAGVVGLQLRVLEVGELLGELAEVAAADRLQPSSQPAGEREAEGGGGEGQGRGGGGV